MFLLAKMGVRPDCSVFNGVVGMQGDGPDYKKHIVSYKLHSNIETQREWVRNDYGE